MIYAFLLHAVAFVVSIKMPLQGQYSFIHFLTSKVLSGIFNGGITEKITAIILVIAEAIFLNRILTHNLLFSRDTMIPAFFYITFSSLFGQWFGLNNVLIAQAFIMFSVFNLFALSQAQNELPRENIFFTSFALSVGCLFYFPAIIFFPVMLGGLIVRAYSGRDIALNIIGFIIPFYFVGIYFYWIDELPNFLITLQKIFTPQVLKIEVGLPKLIFILCSVLMGVYGFFVLRNNEEYRTLKTRRMLNMLFIYFVLLMFAMPVIVNDKLAYVQLFALPCAVFTAKVYDRDKINFYQMAALGLLLAGIVFFQLEYARVIDVNALFRNP
ncbi:MAG: DUF6427 family protein [Bacteroidetes bacterium]|nr:DUF6427 family protein [Bacteroidota bacterium]